MQPHDLGAGFRTRLEDFRADERLAVEQIATILASVLYGRTRGDLRSEIRGRLDGAAMRALRGSQMAWNREAWTRAYVALNDALSFSLGADFRTLPVHRRVSIAHEGTHAVLTALLGVFEVEQPFEDITKALQVYDTAHAQAREAK